MLLGVLRGISRERESWEKESTWMGPNPRAGVWEGKRMEKGIVSTGIASGPGWRELLCPITPQYACALQNSEAKSFLWVVGVLVTAPWKQPHIRSLAFSSLRASFTGSFMDLFTESPFLWSTHLNLSIHLPILINLLLLSYVCSFVHWFEPATVHVNCTGSFCFIDLVFHSLFMVYR